MGLLGGFNELTHKALEQCLAGRTAQIVAIVIVVVINVAKW